MVTELKRFDDAYATMTVALYEPLIVRWVSTLSIALLADTLALRAPKTAVMGIESSLPTAIQVSRAATRAGRLGPIVNPVRLEAGSAGIALDNTGAPIPDRFVAPSKVQGLDEATSVGDSVYPTGVLRSFGETAVKAPAQTEASTGFLANTLYRLRSAANAAAGKKAAAARREGQPRLGARSVPIVANRSQGSVPPGFDFHAERGDLFKTLLSTVDTWATAETGALSDMLTTAAAAKAFAYFPIGKIEEFLSPIGVAHLYRQHYFNAKEGVGPLEQSFTIAPLESLEVMYENVRRQIHEELIEIGSEEVSESAVESKNVTELSDKVSSMIQRDTAVAMSASASGSIGVFSASASASATLGFSQQRSRDDTSRRLKETTRKASQRITKSVELKVRDVEETTSTSLTRRVIRNDDNVPVSYGLRRVLRKVNVKVQDLGTRMVWQLYVRNPGAGLARSRFVYYRDPGEITLPDVPPGVSKRPGGGTDTGSTSSSVWRDPGRGTDYVTLVFNPGPDRVVESVSIDAISDLEGGGKDDEAPAPRNDIQWPPAAQDQATNTYAVNIAISRGDSSSVSLTYTYAYKPSQAALDAWQKEVDAARKTVEEKALIAKFEREKATLTALSKTRPRPANDLRREERYEVMNRMVSQLFARGDDPSVPTPLEIEYFHRYFDIEMMFTYLHPSWWKPRYSPVASGLQRETYAITDKSDPAPMGASLGWMIQIDGDTRRNEFINSPWVRACLPIRPYREREAIAWLARHIEGDKGFKLDSGPLAEALKDIEAIRKNEETLGSNGADYVKIDSTVGAPPGPLTPEQVYPVIDEFDVTVPTDGFVYETLKLSGGS